MPDRAAVNYSVRPMAKSPRKWLSCNVSAVRDTERGYCSEVCCMYALKESMLLKKQYPDAEVTIYYMDLRAFGKDYYRYQLASAASGSEIPAVPRLPYPGKPEDKEPVPAGAR